MTRRRRSKRELERAVADLAGEHTDAGEDTGVSVDWVSHGEDPTPDADIVIRRHIVMDRGDAERENRTIIGPAGADMNDDVVRVAPES